MLQLLYFIFLNETISLIKLNTKTQTRITFSMKIEHKSIIIRSIEYIELVEVKDKTNLLSFNSIYLSLRLCFNKYLYSIYKIKHNYKFII